MKTRTFEWIALTFAIVGAINWGLFGFFQFDLVAMLFGGYATAISRVIYALIGIAGLYCISLYRRIETDQFAQTVD